LHIVPAEEKRRKGAEEIFVYQEPSFLLCSLSPLLLCWN